MNIRDIASRIFRFPALTLFLAAVCLAIPLLYFWSEEKIAEQNDLLLSFLHLRADNTLWAVENAVKLFQNDPPEKISELLRQMAHQPGIAWLAIVDSAGIIVADSVPELQGKKLYTSGEMQALQPQNSIRGRFSPDEPDVFEAWKVLKIFNGQKNKTQFILFAAFDFSHNTSLLKEYARQLYWQIFLVCLIVISFFTIFYLAWLFKKSGKKLEAARAMALQVVRNFPDGLLVTDSSGNIISFNKNFLLLLDTPSLKAATLSELPGEGWLELLRISGAMPETGDIPLADGKVLQVTVTSIYSGQKKLAGFLFVAADKQKILSRKEKEIEKSKFAALGKVASGIAHEIRNPLGAMCGYASFLAERLENDAHGKKAARLLLEEGKRLNNVLSEMLTLTRKPQLQKTSLPLGMLLEKLLLLASSDSANKNVAVAINYTPQDLQFQHFYMDKDKMLQALLNILINAINASPANGAIEIDAILKSNKFDHILELSFKDQGPGISPANLEQIFNPYFTTSPNGTGLGLTLAKNIVESHGGSIKAENAANGGAIFKIDLPWIQHEKGNQ